MFRQWLGLWAKFLIREFHLSPPGKGGVSCDAEGAFFGAIPILDRLQKDGRDAWRPRDFEELSEEIGEHYGLPIDISSKKGGLKAIANALNEGDVARAQIATVLLGIPDPPQLSKRDRSRDQMIKLIRDLHWSGILKWDEDEHPRWPAGSTDSKGGQFAPKGEDGDAGASPTSRSNTANRTYSPHSESNAPRRDARVQLADAGISDAYDDPVAEAARAAAAAGEDASRHPPAPPKQTFDQTLEQTFEQKYDDLGPVDFSKKVYEFSYQLEAHGRNLPPAARQHALAEYEFLQGRLDFWLAYDYKSETAHNNLLGAAHALYQGAINGKIVEVGHLPRSMLNVFSNAWYLEGGQSHIPSARMPNLEPVMPREEFEGSEEIGQIVGSGPAKESWGKGFKIQGDGWEVYIDHQAPPAKRLRMGTKTFDFFVPETGEAISAKTLNTQTFNRIKNPTNIYSTLKRYIDAAANYSKPRTWFDLKPEEIKSKTIQLAIPELTSPEQWRQLFRAIIYARKNRVSVVITRIRQ